MVLGAVPLATERELRAFRCETARTRPDQNVIVELIQYKWIVGILDGTWNDVRCKHANKTRPPLRMVDVSENETGIN